MLYLLLSRLTVYGAFLLPDKCILCGKPATITHGHAPAVSLDTLQSSGGSFAFRWNQMTAKNGKPCKKCGTSEWDRFGGCIRCKSVRTMKWQKDNPERYAAIREKYEKSNPDRGRKWRQANPEKCNAQSRKWRATNPEKFSKSVRKYVLNNLDVVRAKNNSRRTAKTKAGGSYTASEWLDLVHHFGDRCLCCGRTDVKLTADHVIPVSKGGTSNIENIQPLCQACNTRKKDKTIDYRPESSIGRWIQRKMFG